MNGPQAKTPCRPQLQSQKIETIFPPGTKESLSDIQDKPLAKNFSSLTLLINHLQSNIHMHDIQSCRTTYAIEVNAIYSNDIVNPIHHQDPQMMTFAGS